MASASKLLGGAATIAAVGATLWALQRPRRGAQRRKGPTAFRILLTLAVGVGAYWQEKKRMQEVADYLATFHGSE